MKNGTIIKSIGGVFSVIEQHLKGTIITIALSAGSVLAALVYKHIEKLYADDIDISKKYDRELEYLQKERNNPDLTKEEKAEITRLINELIEKGKQCHEECNNKVERIINTFSDKISRYDIS